MDLEDTIAALDQAALAARDMEAKAAAAGYFKASDGHYRRPSKAHLINGGPRSGLRGYQDTYVKGSFISSIAAARSGDFEAQMAGKAALAEISDYMTEHDVRAYSKATLGTTDATGGWIVPSAAVDTITKAAAFKNPYANLMTFRRNVTATAVDIPFRSASPARAIIAAPGTTKENVNLAYNGYTATMYTIARIHDLGNQFLRQSAGAAEEDVLSELAVAFALGESFYIREGVGTTEPFGYLGAITNGPAAFRTAHTAGTSLAGSVAAAIAKAAAALYGRGRTPEAAVISALGMAELLTNGADAAGFYVSGISTDPLPNFRGGTLISPFGIPIVVDPDLASDDLIVAEWSAFRVYLGESYRVDSSNQAGTRWDENTTGFRGEEDLAFDGRPAVYSGAAQLVTDILS